VKQIFTDRIVLALCGMSIRIPGRLVGYFTTALELINEAKTVEQSVLGLTMLTFAPEEVENADVSRAVQVELQDQLINFSMQFAVLMNQLAEKALYSREFFAALLKQLTAWLPQGMTLSKLYADHHQSFEMLCMAVKMTDVQLIAEGCGAIKALVVLKEYPRPEKRTEALRALLACVNSQVQTLLAPYQTPASEGHTIDTDDDSGRALVELCSVYVTLASSAADGEFFCTGYYDASIPQRETDLLVGFYTNLLGIIRLKPRSLAFSTFDFWAEFQDFAPAEWHPLVRDSVLQELFTIVVSHCTLPASSASWSQSERDLSDDQEDFVSFRDARLGIQEALGLCMTLKSQFFGVLQAQLESFERNPAQWMQLEVVLFVLHSCMEAIKEIVMKLTYQDKAYQQSILQFLYNTLHLVLSLPPSFYYEGRALTSLHQSVCKFVGSLTFLLTSNVNERAVMQLSNAKFVDPTTGVAPSVVYITSLYYLALRSVLAAADSAHAVTASEAAKAVHKLSVHGCKRLTAELSDPALSADAWQTIVYTVTTTGMYIEKPTFEQAALLVLVESVTRCVMELSNLDAKTQMLSSLGDKITHSLTVELQKPIVSDTRLVNLLAVASQLIRFSDVTGEDGAPHPLVPFLTSFWPVLQQISADTRVAQYPAVECAIFGIFGKVLMSVGKPVYSQVPNIMHAVLSSVAARGASAAAALECARTLVDCLGHQASASSDGADAQAEKGDLLLGLVAQITDMYTLTPNYQRLESQAAAPGSSTDCMQLFGVTFDAMEQYFTLIQTYLVFCRDVIARSSAQLVEKVAGLCCVGLAHCTEKEPLRPIMLVLQSLFVASNKFAQEPTNANATRGVQSQFAIMTALSGYGPRFTRLLLELLSAARIPSSLVPNTTETLYCLLIACETPSGVPAGTQPWAALSVQSRQWVEAVVLDAQCFTP